MDDDGHLDPLDALLRAFPEGAAEQSAWLDALARRGVLAVVDGDRAALADVVERIGSWEDDPGLRIPSGAFESAARKARDIAVQLIGMAGLPAPAVARRAVPLVEASAPAACAASARAMLETLAATGEFGLAGEPAFVAAASVVAAAAAEPAFRIPREQFRLILVKQIRDNEAAALRVPARERITDVPDSEAVAFLDDLYGPRFLPRDPAARTSRDHDVLAVAKQHLLETPADATSPEHRAAFDARIRAVFEQHGEA